MAARHRAQPFQEDGAMLVQTRVMCLVMLLTAAPAFAQGERPQDRASSSASNAMSAKPLSAPVGHRQPTAADLERAGVPPKPDQEIEQDKRDLELDSRLKICRNC